MNERKKFAVFKSSAGSGKTYTLVREYVALALKSPLYFRHILAITFTNKAANEMKQRIILALLHLSDIEKYASTSTVLHMLPELQQSTGLSKQEVSGNASQVFTRILHGYDDFSVRTIDSFITRIVRTFAHDLHLAVDFEIELDEGLILDKAVDQLISRVGVEADLTKVLLEFTESLFEDDKNWQIEPGLKKTAKMLFSEGDQENIQKIHEISHSQLLGIIKDINAFRKNFSRDIMTIAEKAVDLIENNGISIDSFFHGNSGIGAFFKKLAYGEISTPNSYAVQTIQNDKWTSSGCSQADAQSIMHIKDDLKRMLADCIIHIDIGLQRYKLLEMVMANIYQVGILGALQREIEQIYHDKSILHISEFNKRISEIILREPVPFVYERIGEKYANYLVDEFQDTSELQWKNLLPLMGNSLANGNFNLVVGDAKQAIYRFRSGKVEQFVALPGLPEDYEKTVFGETEQALKDNFQLQKLETNYRSKSEIISFNNSFFGFAAQQGNPEIAEIYKNHKQIINDSSEGGFVRLEFLPYTGKSDFSSLNIIRVHELILELLEKGYALSDVTILTRSNDEGSQIARYLVEQGIRVVSSEALLVIASAEVNLLVSVLAFLNDRNNEIAKVNILNELIRKGRIPNELIELCNFRKGTHLDLIQIIDEAGIDLNFEMLSGMPLYDMCEEIIRKLQLNNQPYNLYLQFFLDFVSKFSSKQSAHLSDLLVDWEQQKEKLSVVVPEGIDALKVMTIHKSKGLEFPVVIWPMATASLRTTLDQLWVKLDDPAARGLPVALLKTGKTMEEVGYGAEYATERNHSLLDLMNMIYVAFTRPIERLYVLTREVKNASVDNLHGLLAKFVAENPEAWENEDSTYSRGWDTIRTRNENRPGENDTGMDSVEMISVPWQGRIRMARRAPAYWSVDSSRDRQSWGNLIHDAIAAIHSEDDIQNVVKLKCSENLLSIVDSEKLFANVKATITHPLLAEYFGSGNTHKPEAAILNPDGAVYRPDRVIFNESETVILEFKTGSEQSSHQKQLTHYADLLLQMGYSNIKKLLVYIGDPVEVMEI